MKNNIPFIYGPEHQSLSHCKTKIQHAPLLAYYDPNNPTVLQTHTLGYGLGSVILQNGKTVSYSSKALQQHKQGYVALECEALAVMWAFEKNHHHVLYGHCCTLETDQKCL